MEKLIKTLKKNIVISLKDAIEIMGNQMAVYRLEQKGVIRKVYPDGLGYFSLPDVEEGEAQFAIVAKYYPDCVVSGKTAMVLYGLSKDYIREIDVDIPNTKNLANALLKVHRVVKSKIVCVEERSFEDRGVPFKIKIYSPERTLHEAYKYYKGSEAYFEAIKAYKENFLNKENPGDQFDIILKINKKVGREILDLISMGLSQ